MIYFLHIPRTGGTSVFQSLKKYTNLKFPLKNINGQAIDKHNKLIKYWNFNYRKQLKFIKRYDLIINEECLGRKFYPTEFCYFTVLRDPRDIILSLLQNLIQKKNFQKLKNYYRNIYEFSEYQDLSKEYLLYEINKLISDLDYQKFNGFIFKRFYDKNIDLHLIDKKNLDKIKKIVLSRYKLFHVLNFNYLNDEFINFCKLIKLNYSSDKILFKHPRYSNHKNKIFLSDLNLELKNKIDNITKFDRDFFFNSKQL